MRVSLKFFGQRGNVKNYVRGAALHGKGSAEI